MRARFSTAVVALLALAACRQDETIRAYGMGDAEWRVETLRGAAFDAQASLGFTEPGRIGGRAPCNTYAADMDIPFPWWGIGPIAATKRACPRLPAETAFFEALAAAELAQVVAGRLVLSAEDGTELLTFTPAD